MKRLLIDAVYKEEVRVAITNDDRLEKFETELLSKKNIQGNIFLGKIVRIEPSLQAAFVEYGGNRHGFLSLSEVHPDYFQIPQEDKITLEEHIKNVTAFYSEKKHHEEHSSAEHQTVQEEQCEYVNYAAEEDFDEITSDEASLQREIRKIKAQFFKKYRIQEILRKRQVLLVQVMKEERSHKGAALTTYLSISGRYCVLMPNSQKPNGISKRITAAKDRARLKEIIQSLIPSNDMCAVIRTAGLHRTKKEIAADFNFLLQTWQEICKKTLQSTAPCLIYEDMSLIGRAIRDMYNSEIEEIIVEGEEGYRTTKDFISKIISKRHSSKVIHYTDHGVPLFNKYKVNTQIASLLNSKVDLPSGGSIVIGITEALVAIDVNSGKATRERNINETALKTNIEAAAEIARQCILRDLGGLIVIDFIDMSDVKHQQQVCKAVQEAFKHDKANLQIGSISDFGLLELSRQRLKTTILDDHTEECPHCKGTGVIWDIDIRSLQIMRKIEEMCGNIQVKTVQLTLSSEMAFYILNHKRAFINNLEQNGGFKLFINMDDNIHISDYTISTEKGHVSSCDSTSVAKHVHMAHSVISGHSAEHTAETKSKKKRKRKKHKEASNNTEHSIEKNNEETADNNQEEISAPQEADVVTHTASPTRSKSKKARTKPSEEKKEDNKADIMLDAEDTTKTSPKKRKRRKKAPAAETTEFHASAPNTDDKNEALHSESLQEETKNSEQQIVTTEQETDHISDTPARKPRIRRSKAAAKKKETKHENVIDGYPPEAL